MPNVVDVVVMAKLVSDGFSALDEAGIDEYAADSEFFADILCLGMKTRLAGIVKETEGYQRQEDGTIQKAVRKVNEEFPHRLEQSWVFRLLEMQRTVHDERERVVELADDSIRCMAEEEALEKVEKGGSGVSLGQS
ncbi:hypothetical protein V5O48_016185 [Marasmius crinis-equi]|uniref:Uncharacterized protein n=1 Tax=Marasmius crinis-equi TaxID=585013 RepID=A0ABR3ESF0_9AGAR